jgi:hypothetical protein
MDISTIAMLVMPVIRMAVINFLNQIKVKLKVVYFIFLMASFPLAGQAQQVMIEGNVTFKSSKNIYVRFNSTEFIRTGDTLFIKVADNWIPALIVNQKSSTSCVCTSYTTENMVVGQLVSFFPKFIPIPEKKPSEDVIPETIPLIVTPDTVKNDSVVRKIKKQLINGRLTFSTNASINSDNSSNFQRIRTAFSVNVQNIRNSAFSTQAYITYRHRYGIDQITTNFYDDFKVFTLAVQYAPGDKFNVWVGRKMNNNMANMGAIDGIQTEYKINKLIIGAFAGSRPDFTDFSFNPALNQFGAYLVRNDKTDSGMAQTSIAIAEQQNDFKTDRRFIYLQHNNSLIKNLNLFLSSELDLYKKINGEVSNTPNITSVYLSLRYRLRKNLSISTSYDNRRNIIYYESYQTYIDQLLAQETRQGFRVQMNYSPFKSISINASTFYRYQGDNPTPTKNYVGNINFNNIPGLKMNVAVNANVLESYYFKGTIIGGRVSDDFLKGKINAELNYRNVNYTFFNSESSLQQHIAGFNLNFNLLKKTSLILSYEGTFEPKTTYHRYFITAIQRFKN